MDASPRLGSRGAPQAGQLPPGLGLIRHDLENAQVFLRLRGGRPPWPGHGQGPAGPRCCRDSGPAPPCSVSQRRWASRRRNGLRVPSKVTARRYSSSARSSSHCRRTPAQRRSAPQITAHPTARFNVVVCYFVVLRVVSRSMWKKYRDASSGCLHRSHSFSVTFCGSSSCRTACASRMIVSITSAAVGRLLTSPTLCPATSGKWSR